MKKILSIILAYGGLAAAYGQNGLYGPEGVYGPHYNAATTIANGGSALVTTGGNWFMAGGITGADKGNPNTPTATGKTEVITFDGTGTYSNAATGAGAPGFVVDGYAAASNQAAAFILPTGVGGTAYPITVPAGAALTAAYFTGSGSSQNTVVTGGANPNTSTEYSNYYDMPAGIPAGTYTLSYPSGYSVTPYSSVLTSNNTSAGGTTGGTTYAPLYNSSTFANTASTTTGAIAAQTATQVYFSTSSAILPVTWANFTGLASGCTANLAWQTGSESNSLQYDVQASTDGSSFATAGTVASKNSPTGAAYTFTANLVSGTNYFRLKAVDKDNSYTYSGTVAVTGTCGMAKVMMSPNPVANLLTVTGVEAGSSVQVYNTLGQALITKTGTGSTLQLNLAPYASGNYYVRVLKAGQVMATQKVVKQ